MNTDTELLPRDGTWQPVAYVTMQDSSVRAGIVDLLRSAGWIVISQPTGFHLIQAISGVIEGRQPWLQPGLIVVDAYSRGTSGVTIAAGLRDLGITIPIVLVAPPGEALPVAEDATVRIVDAPNAVTAVMGIAKIHAPATTKPEPAA